MQHEITEGGPLLDETGDLAQRGFMRQLLLTYNPQNIRRFSSQWSNRLRLKEWDYYGTICDDFFFSVCITHLGYMGLAFAYIIDFEKRNLADNFLVTPFGLGFEMPHSSEAGDTFYHSGKVEIDLLRKRGKRLLRVQWPGFYKKQDLSAELEVIQPKTADGIVMATPMGKGLFYYNHKINGMATGGYVNLGDLKRRFDPKTGFTCMDWGRGVWPFKTFWIWSNASGRLIDGRVFGLNMGCGFGDLSAATENCFFVNGVMNKLEWVEIRYDKKHPDRQWTFKDDQNRCDLTFDPIYVRKSNINIGLIKAKGRQVFGRYNGMLVCDNGERIEIGNVPGWSEDHDARW